MPLLTGPHAPWSSFIWDVSRLCLWLVLLTAVFVPLERACALHPARVLRRGIWTDLGYYCINSLLPAALLAVPLAMLATVVHQVVPSGWYSTVQSWPMGGRMLVGLVVADVGSYWGHRLSHTVPWLWRFHAVHHSAPHMDFLVNTRAHPVDLVVVRLFGLVPLTLLGLGSAGPQGALLPMVITLVGTFAGFFVHANVRWRFGPLEWLVATPAFHHWHHSKIAPVNRNYAATLPCIDRLFGTYHLPAAQWPAQYGIARDQPETLGGQLVEPLMALWSRWFPRARSSEAVGPDAVLAKSVQ
ncbi:hypothetical protein os1_24720 [Comamonadaceae bacterium OS-1]|nr:hypothetical protein os1_24720 [Comamonadaceae bacterium OS-1]